MGSDEFSGPPSCRSTHRRCLPRMDIPFPSPVSMHKTLTMPDATSRWISYKRRSQQASASSSTCLATATSRMTSPTSQSVCTPSLPPTRAACVSLQLADVYLCAPVCRLQGQIPGIPCECVPVSIGSGSRWAYVDGVLTDGNRNDSRRRRARSTGTRRPSLYVSRILSLSAIGAADEVDSFRIRARLLRSLLGVSRPFRSDSPFCCYA